jgi:hypothetical protein
MEEVNRAKVFAKVKRADALPLYTRAIGSFMALVSPSIDPPSGFLSFSVGWAAGE